MRERAILGAVLVAALLLPAVVRSPYVLHVAVLSGIYVLLTLSLNLVTGFCGQFSLGHAGFYGIGAYTAALLAVTWGSPFLLNFLAAAAAAGAAGFLIGLPTLRLGGIYLAMATLGFGEIIHLVLLNWLSLTRGPLGIPAAELGLSEDGEEVTELEGFGPSFADELEELAQEIETSDGADSAD